VLRPTIQLPLAAAGVLALCVSLPAHAGDIGSGTLSPTSGPVTYSSGPFLISNPTVQSGLATGSDQPICMDPVAPCDDYSLTVSIPAGYTAQHPLDRVVVTVDWPTAQDDFDMWVLDPTGKVVTGSATGGRPEVVPLPIADGTTQYTIRVTPFLVTGDSYTATVTLGPAPYTPFVPSTAPAPTYAAFAAPNNWGADYGEPSLGFDPRTNAFMFTGRRYLNVAGKTLKVTFDEATGQPTWVDATPPTSLGTSLDPIGFTDRVTGRSFVSQLHGACSLTELSDDDGATWIPSQGCGIGTVFDHQTFGGGPFAPPLVGGTPVYPNAVYYCAQADVEASCAVSLDGGLTFGAAVPVYTTQCGGLHGHLKVAADGTVYLPNKQCGATQGLVVSTDNGQSWQIRGVPDTLPGDSDPAVAIGSDGTVYYGYVNGDGHMRVAVSHDHGLSWVNDVDVGTPFGIKNAVFPAAIAGDGDRAAVAFHGTATGGPPGGLDFTGVWFLYVATTYDGGKTWSVVRADPNPVQGPGGICTLGFSCSSDPDNRNLLDFFDASMDAKGRVVVGYSDGCTGACGANGTPNNFDSYGTLSRQTSGLTLLSRFDPRPATEDITSFVRVKASGASTQGGTTTIRVRLDNQGAQAFAAPIHLVLADLQSPSSSVTAANADNGKSGPGATWEYSNAVGADRVLSPKETSAERVLTFSNATRAKFTVDFRVVHGDPNASAIPAQNGSGGGEVRYLRLTVDALTGLVSVSTLIR